MGYINEVMRQQVEQLAQEQNRVLEAEVIKRLEAYGYEFTSKEEFYLFISKRITRITLGPFHNEIRLDYHSEQEPGKLIISWSTEVKIHQDGCKVTATIG